MAVVPTHAAARARLPISACAKLSDPRPRAALLRAIPHYVGLLSVSTTPSGTYTGNETDEIILPAEGTRDDIRRDTTLADRGVPYRIGGPTGGKTFPVGQKGAAPL